MPECVCVCVCVYWHFPPDIWYVEPKIPPESARKSSASSGCLIHGGIWHTANSNNRGWSCVSHSRQKRDRKSSNLIVRHNHTGTIIWKFIAMIVYCHFSVVCRTGGDIQISYLQFVFMFIVHSLQHYISFPLWDYWTFPRSQLIAIFSLNHISVNVSVSASVRSWKCRPLPTSPPLAVNCLYVYLWHLDPEKWYCLD